MPTRFRAAFTPPSGGRSRPRTNTKYKQPSRKPSKKFFAGSFNSSFIHKSLDDLAKEFIKKSTPDKYADFAAGAYEFAKTFAAYEMGKRSTKFATNIAAPTTQRSAGRDTDSTVPMMVVNSIATRDSLGTHVPKASYSSLVLTGKPTSKLLKQLSKEYGVITKTLFDTKQYLNSNTIASTSASALPRQLLTHSHGFNLRNFTVMPTASTITYKNLVESVGFSQTQTASDGFTPVADGQVVYGSLLNSTSMIQFINQSRFFPIKFKVHIVNALDSQRTSTPARNIFLNMLQNWQPVTINSTTGLPTFPTTFDRAEIPYYFRVAPAKFEGGAQPDSSAIFETTSWDQLNVGRGLLSSDYFRENYDIVKTISKTLEPNESWLFKHRHEYGSGTDLSSIFQSYVNDRNLSGISPGSFSLANYFYIIETTGKPVEGVFRDVTGTNEPRFGTSPGYYFYEFKTEFQFVNGNASLSTLQIGADGAGAPLGGQQQRMHIRAFTKDYTSVRNSSNAQPFHRVASNINFSATTTPNSFWIPVETTTQLVLAGASTKTGTGDEESSNSGGVPPA